MLTASDWQALWLTMQLAAVTTVLLVLVCLPVAWWLGRGRSLSRQAVNAVTALPLVLPPTVMGFYLLLLLGANGPLAALFGQGLAFSFTGIVIGSMLYSLPFVLQPMANAFRSLDQDVLDAAASLGGKPFDRFWTIALPQAWPGILTAAVLGFAHTVGEFGLIVMLGGSIPGETLVASVAIFEYVESSQPDRAHGLAAVLVGFSLVMLLCIYGVQWWRERGDER